MLFEHRYPSGELGCLALIYVDDFLVPHSPSKLQTGACSNGVNGKQENSSSTEESCKLHKKTVNYSPDLGPARLHPRNADRKDHKAKGKKPAGAPTKH